MCSATKRDFKFRTDFEPKDLNAKAVLKSLSFNLTLSPHITVV